MGGEREKTGGYGYKILGQLSEGGIRGMKVKRQRRMMDKERQN